MRQKLFALWKHDNFPYVLGGTVKEVLKGGLVIIEEYGCGTFRYTKLLPLESGQELIANLTSITQDYHLEHKKLRDEKLELVNKLIEQS